MLLRPVGQHGEHADGGERQGQRQVADLLLAPGRQRRDPGRQILRQPGHSSGQPGHDLIVSRGGAGRDRPRG